MFLKKQLTCLLRFEQVEFIQSLMKSLNLKP